MFTRKNATAFVAAGLVAGAVIGSALPASAARKHDAPTASNVSAHKTVTGAAVGQSRSSAPQVPSLRRSGTAIPMTATADLCSSYPDGHGDLCMWYFSGFTGSSAGFLRNDANLVDDRFVSVGSGQSSLVTNNAESVWNYDRFKTAFVATSPGYTGFVGFVSPWSGGNFSSTYRNNVESLYWVA
jgi:Peptidase inhibitor family I36